LGGVGEVGGGGGGEEKVGEGREKGKGRGTARNPWRLSLQILFVKKKGKEGQQ